MFCVLVVSRGNSGNNDDAREQEQGSPVTCMYARDRERRTDIRLSRFTRTRTILQSYIPPYVTSSYANNNHSILILTPSLQRRLPGSTATHRAQRSLQSQSTSRPSATCQTPPSATDHGLLASNPTPTLLRRQRSPVPPTSQQQRDPLRRHRQLPPNQHLCWLHARPLHNILTSRRPLTKYHRPRTHQLRDHESTEKTLGRSARVCGFGRECL